MRTDGYLPIRDYAVIGNKRTAALVGLDGAIDWMCVPAFDGPPVLGALLDAERGGHFRLAPAIPFEATRAYREDTNIVETTFRTDRGVVRLTDAMSWPIAHTLLWTQVIRRVDGVSGAVPMAWSCEPRFGYRQQPGRSDVRGGVPVVSDSGQTMALETFDAGQVERTGTGFAGAFEATEGGTALVALSAFGDEPLTFSMRDALLARIDETGRRWASRLERCTYDGPWSSAVRRSVLALDLLIDGQAGAVTAAATMGLPERIGGPRNFDYRYAWLRDANLTLEAMQRVGYGDEVHSALGWILRTVRQTTPRLRPMYRLDGGVRLPDEKLPLPGYRHSEPVLLGNGAQDQLQLGNFADVLDMARKHVEAGNALDRGDGEELAELADHVCLLWDHPDAGLWELGERRQYTQSKLACWLTLDDALALARAGMLPSRTADRWTATRDRIRAYIDGECWSRELGAYTRTPGSDELDASVLLASRGPFFEANRDRLSSTIDVVRDRLGAGGPLVYRYSGMESEEGAFVACSFWIAEALARAGRLDESAEVLDGMITLSNDVGLLSEQIDPATGAFLGNLPQALSHLALVNAAHAHAMATSSATAAAR